MGKDRVTGENHENLVVLCGMRTFIKKQRPKETVKPKYFYAKFDKVYRVMKKNHSSKIHMHPYVHCSSIYNRQDMEAT